MHTSSFDGVTFIEGVPNEMTSLGDIEVSIGGILNSAQLRNLDDVKRLMVVRVRAAGGNAIVNFKYGQKSVGLLASLFQRDDVSWYGSGTIARID